VTENHGVGGSIPPLGTSRTLALSIARSSTVAADYSFSVVLEPQQDGGFTVLVPALPEVVTEGDTEQEALANAEEAIRAVLAFRRDNGLLIPSDARPEIRRVTVAA
jgi:antitoxin HicB